MSAGNADITRAICGLCNVQNVATALIDENDLSDDGEESDSDIVESESEEEAKNEDRTLPVSNTNLESTTILPDNYIGPKSGEEIGHLMLASMKSLQAFSVGIGRFGMLDFNQASISMLFQFKITYS
jgi:hypothetical protein